jgi:hypothetical protein
MLFIGDSTMSSAAAEEWTKKRMERKKGPRRRHPGLKPALRLNKPHPALRINVEGSNGAQNGKMM